MSRQKERTAKRQKARKLKVTALEPKKRSQRDTCATISLRYVDEPKRLDFESQLEWLFQCLGFGNEDDRIAKEVFKEIVRNAKGGVRSADISARCDVTQGAVVYHLNTFMKNGIVIKRGRFYHLKKPSVDATLMDLEDEILRRFERMRRIARMIDNLIWYE